VPVLTVPIQDIVAATPRSRLLTLNLQKRALDYLPGQAVMVGTHGQSERRPYSIACSPERAAEIGGIELLIALEARGTLGSNLSGASAGTLVDVDGPMGAFTFPATTELPWLLFVAGGSGVAPLRAMLDHALRLQLKPRISFLYSARRGDELAFIDELRGYAGSGRIELHQTVTRDESQVWTGGRGRIGRSHFEAVIHEPAATLCFVCGPGALVKESVGTLRELGVPDAQIRIEQWGG
jgi:NAD(P)H-flavin reductase